MAVTIVVSTSAFGQTGSKRIQLAKGKTSATVS